MPVAKVYVPEGILTPDQRREIVSSARRERDLDAEFTMSSSVSSSGRRILRPTC